MKALPFDVSRCQPDQFECKERFDCARHVSPYNPAGFQSVHDFSGLREAHHGCHAFKPVATLSMDQD